MEKSGRWHESVNKAREITDCCKHALVNLNSPKLILLAPLKCETYFYNRSTLSVLASVEEHYASLFNFLSGFKNTIGFAITPAQTLGNILLADCQEDRPSPEFIFKPIYPGATYSPRDVDQLWTYILSFVMAQALKSNQWKMSGETCNIVQDTLNNLLSHRKQGADGFKIVQGYGLLG